MTTRPARDGLDGPAPLRERVAIENPGPAAGNILSRLARSINQCPCRSVGHEQFADGCCERCTAEQNAGEEILRLRDELVNAWPSGAAGPSSLPPHMNTAPEELLDDDGNDQASNTFTLPARARLVGGLGAAWCIRHHGVVNEDSSSCDMAPTGRYDDPDDLDDDGEPLPCETRVLVYVDTPQLPAADRPPEPPDDLR